MQVPESELKKFILDSGLVSRKDVDAAQKEAERRKRSVGDILVSEGLLSSDALRRIKSYVLGIPFVTLAERIPFEILSIIPEPVARTRSVVAFNRGDRTLEVAVLDTEDIPAVEMVSIKTGLTVLPRLTDEASIRSALLQYQKALREEFGNLISTESGKVRGMGEEVTEEALKRTAQDLSIVRIVDTLLRHAMLQGASDIHIETLEQEVLVRYRIDGVLHDAMALPRETGPGIAARVKILANLSLTENRTPQDGRFKMETDGDAVSFRVSFLPTYYGEKLVMRLLRETGEGFTLDALGFHGDSQERIHRALRKGGGMVLVAGPAASGKTTTLYTLVDILNTPDVSIATVEDPIEYQMKRVNQTQVDEKIGFTFANGLRSVLRQDPDIVMVGELKDEETATLAVNAALTGHLVLVSMSANTGPEAIRKLIAMGVDPLLLASTLRLVITQRLVRKLCDRKDAYTLTHEQKEAVAGNDTFAAALNALVNEKLLKGGAKIDTVPFYRAVPSTECEDGYRGRTGIHEVITVSAAMRDRIREGALPDMLEAQARKEHTLSLVGDGIYAAARGITSIEEVVRVTGG